MKKKSMSFLLVLLLLVGLVPQAAFAQETFTSVAEEKFQSRTRTSRLDLRDMESTSNPAEGWTWDSENNILTLENINFVVGSDPSAIRMNSGTIVLKGTNRIICTYDDGKENKGISALAVSGISAFNSSLVFEGTGSWMSLQPHTEAMEFPHGMAVLRLTVGYNGNRRHLHSIQRLQ